jgi:FkbM family methyltransferase
MAISAMNTGSRFMQWLTIRKGIFCAFRPRLWRHLIQGVAPTIEHTMALSRFSFRTVVDIGANRGQFATMARILFPDAEIHSFEPLDGPAKTFQSILGDDKAVHLYSNAIGPEATTATIYITTRDDSSSLLQPGRAQEDVFGVRTARTEQIPVMRLSDCLGASAVNKPALLKIDVQGGELDVLKGSDDLLDRFDVVYVECSYVRMYDNQPLFLDIVQWLVNYGFMPRGIFNQHSDPHHGPVQADVLFLRPLNDAAERKV